MFKKNVSALLAAVTLLVTGVAFAGPVQYAPDFTLKDTDGNDVTLSDYRGWAIVLCFFTRS